MRTETACPLCAQDSVDKRSTARRRSVDRWRSNCRLTLGFVRRREKRSRLLNAFLPCSSDDVLTWETLVPLPRERDIAPAQGIARGVRDPRTIWIRLEPVRARRHRRKGWTYVPADLD